MNILFVSESIWMEGVVYDLHILAEGLSVLGHKIYAIDPGLFSDGPVKIEVVNRVFPQASVDLIRPYFRRLSLFGRPIETTRWLKEPYKAYRRYREIGKFLKQNQVDVIVLYSAVRNGLQTVYWAKKLNIPVVFRNVDKLYNLWPTPLTRTIAKNIEKRVYPKLDKALALTPKYAEYLIDLGADREKVELLLFPIDINQFHPSIDCSDLRIRWNLDSKDQVIVFMGTLYEFGGLLDFTREFPSIVKEVPNAKLLIVGDGPIRPQLEQVIKDLSLENNIILTGYQPFEHMPQYINLATVCLNVFPLNKTTQDIFSAKIIQYLSCGKATVSTSLPGITTLLNSNECGVVYADTTEGLNREILELLKSPERRDYLGRIGRCYVEDAHGHEKIILKLEEVLKKLSKVINNSAEQGQ